MGVYACIQLYPSYWDITMNLWGVESSNCIFGDASHQTGASNGAQLNNVCHETMHHRSSKRRRFLGLEGRHEVGTCKDRISEGSAPLAEFLQWMKQLALYPGDPMKGRSTLRSSKQNIAKLDDLLTMAWKVRAVLWERRNFMLEGYLPGCWSKQKLPPALYYKEPSKPKKETIGKLRANHTRVLKFGMHDPCNTLNTYGLPSKGLNEQTVDHAVACGHDPEFWNEELALGYLLHNQVSRKRIPIGPYFQAQVPEWTPPNSNADQADSQSVNVSGPVDLLPSMPLAEDLMWPLASSKHTSAGTFGKGRAPGCSCPLSMSVECVRMHVFNERERLKVELGEEAFTTLGFNDMGETVAKHWTNGEMSTFESVVQINPTSLERSFWDVLSEALPLKTMRELVSYYFNVFVLKRRAIQNRMAPQYIDSDDDENDVCVDI